MMKPKSSSFSGYFVGILLLEVMTSASEKWTVTIPIGHLVAIVGGQIELSCQLSPPQSAKHMEVSWFKGDHFTSKLVHLYRDGHEVKGEAAPEYVDRTEFVKEAIGEGKVALRLHNIRVSDNGTYQCSFKDGNFSNMASMDLNVTALGLETQIHIQAPRTDGLMVECNSGGWFPQPQMVCKDSKGEVIPHSSQLYSQDGAGLFHIKMTLLLSYKSQGDMICYIHNPLSDEGKQINIILADALFVPVHNWLMSFFILSSAMLFFIFVLLVYWCFKRKVSRYNFIHILNSIPAQVLGFACFCAMLSIYLHFRMQVSISDPFFSLYNDWIWYMAKMVIILMGFYIVLITALYFTVRGHFKKMKNIWKKSTEMQSAKCRHGKHYKK
ncbi:PREDICTED: selection and upkeep of intraepithelial T-cells protein 8-like [Myotis brandtii]|uniref:selection and upkeep of intraepithelial T-cells protein 8-like n=1 Tax=Myotis brandtii TaxID=109478 RepID=UPI000703C7CF|nr:PREDICTED: selection and upkeep of intraepithelial T-cells protein 8-like [Myotis brandtii]XP_014388106.1 PREDICTED: selection and upkeep of intraepithelial T-cells protein 8-like [Myotis brandtii]